MLLLNNADVAKVLDMPMCLAALDGVFHELAAGDATGLGKQICWEASQHFGSFSSVNFSGKKHDLGFGL